MLHHLFFFGPLDPICFVNVNGRGEVQDGTSHENDDKAAAVVNTVAWILTDSDDVNENDFVFLTQHKTQVRQVNQHLQRKGNESQCGEQL